jgi:hypothetical protein
MTDTKIAVLILGAPRSGTSLISHVISELGFYFGDPARFVDPVTHPWNPIFFELQPLNDLNDEMAKALGVDYLNFDWLPLKDDYSEELIFGFEERVDRFLETEFGTYKKIALKDPRFCLTLPIWNSLLKRHSYAVRFVWAVRDLSSCFMSNKLANDTRSQLQERLVTLSSYLSAYFLDGKSYFLANYDQFIEQPGISVRKLAHQLEVSGPQVETAPRVIQAKLRHVEADKKSLPHELKILSELLLKGKLTANHYLNFRQYLSAHGFIGLLQEQSDLITNLKLAILEKDKYITGLQGAMAAKDQTIAKNNDQISSLSDQISSLSDQISSLNQVVKAYQNSTSWRITKPIRFFGRLLENIRKA